MSKQKFIILRDDREKEKYRWTFAGHRCKKQRLKTADYTVQGYEKQLAIERKRNVSEIHANLSKKNWPRFKAELERLHEMKHAYLLLEFSPQDVAKYPFNLPPHVRRRIKIRGAYLQKRLFDIENEYDVKVIYCGDKPQAINIAYQIMENIVATVDPDPIETDESHP